MSVVLSVLGSFNATGYIARIFGDSVHSDLAPPGVVVHTRNNYILKRVAYEKDCLYKTRELQLNQETHKKKACSHPEDHSVAYSALLSMPGLPPDILLVVFSLGRESLIMNDASGSVYSFQHVCDLEIPALIAAAKKGSCKQNVVFVGISFKRLASGKDYEKVQKSQIEKLIQSIKGSSYLKFYADATEEELESFLSKLEPYLHAPSDSASSSTLEKKTTIDPSEIEVAKNGTIAELQQLVSENKFNPSVKDKLGNSPYHYMAARLGEGHKMLFYLVSQRQIPLLTELVSLIFKSVPIAAVQSSEILILRERIGKEISGTPFNSDEIKKMIQFICHLRKGSWETNTEDKDMLECVKKFQPDKYGEATPLKYAIEHELQQTFNFIYNRIEDKSTAFICFFSSFRAEPQGIDKVVRAKRMVGGDISQLQGLDKRLWQLAPRAVDYIYNRKHYCFGLPSLAHLCVDAMTCSTKNDTSNQLSTLPSDLTKHLEDDEWSKFEWVHHFDKSHKPRMLQLLTDLRNSNIEFDIGKKNGVEVIFVHGYKSREVHGVGKTVAQGSLLLTITDKPTTIDLYMDSYGYFFINTTPTTGTPNVNNSFYLCHGTQMDSLYCSSFFDYLEKLGIRRDEHYPFMVILYNWFHYGVNLSEIFYPERLAPSEWRRQQRGPPEWFLNMTYLYGFRNERQEAEQKEIEKEKEKKKKKR